MPDPTVKHCPFCCHTPRFKRITDKFAKPELSKGFWSLSCMNAPEWICPGAPMSFGSTKEEAAAKWNQRPEWFLCEHEMPDADETVIVHAPKANEPVWFGYFDGEVWREPSGDALTGKDQPIAWRRFPEPPLPH